MASDGALYAVMLALVAQERGYTLRQVQRALMETWRVLEAARDD